MKKLTAIPTLADLQETHEAIKPYIHRTPILSSENLNKIAGAKLFFKCENFQKIGAFKMRGATNALLRMTEAEKKKGVITHSSGNHAQATALAAKLLGLKAYIVMPENAPTAKRNATEGYGAEVITCGNTIPDREATTQAAMKENGAVFMPSYNDYHIIAGQGTAAKELIEDAEALEVVMAPIGGGGLMSGTALATHYLLPNAEIIGAEPKLVDDAYRSMLSGKIETNESVNTIADGLRTDLGPLTFDIIRRHVQEIITVSEEEIINAMQLIWSRMKILIEPSSAVPFAAILQQPEKFKDKRIGIILSGGNMDLGKLPF